MSAFDNLSGQTFGIWKVLAFDHVKWNGGDNKHGMSYYQCECKTCGKTCIKARSQLLQWPNKRHHDCGVNEDAKII